MKSGKGLGGTFWIFSGMLVAGLGQYFFNRIASDGLSESDLSRVLTWNSASFAFGLVIGSPTVTLLIINRGSEDSVARSRQISRASFWIAGICGPIASVVWLLSDGLFRQSALNIHALLLLVMGSQFQSFAAIQRGSYSAEGKWHLVAIQLMVDGVIRSSVWMPMLSLESSPVTYLYSSGLAPLISIGVCRAFSAGTIPRFRIRESRRTDFRGFPPLWCSGFAQHLILTLSPNIVAFSGAPDSTVSRFALLAFVIRVPITLSSTFMTPILARTIDARASSKAVAGIALRTVRITAILGLGVCILTPLIGAPVLDFVFPGHGFQVDEVFMTVVVGLAALIAVELHYFSWSKERFWTVAFAWLIAALIMCLGAVTIVLSVEVALVLELFGLLGTLYVIASSLRERTLVISG
ncbi:MAG: hypothetical protein LW627_03695 [Ilumatobacteraceae bacterium]|nr:hypothetical protein [Ilumatobacteraceae bacterium]